MRRRHINAAVSIDDVFSIWRILHGMVPVSFGERNQTRAIEIHTIKVNEIWILVGVLPAGTKPDLPVFFVDLINPAQNKFSLRDLIFDSAFLRIHQVKMTPTVAF